MVDPDDRSCLNDFTPHAPMPSETIEQWRDQLPKQITDIWQHWGLGTFLDGYLRTINPNDWHELANIMYTPFWLKQPVTPFLATVFGDLIAWNPQTQTVENLQFRNSMTRGSTIKYFFANMPDKQFQQDTLGIRGYKTTRRRLPTPAYNDCYAYTPLICQGGPERTDHLHIANMRDYLESIRDTGYRLDEHTMRFPSR